MARLKYMGVSDHREFSAADLKQLGVEGDDAKKINFPRKEAVEVSDALHEVLLKDARLKGEFADAGEVEPLDDNSKKALAEQEARDAAGDNELSDEAVELTAKQQAKAQAAAEKATAKPTPDNEGATPQTTDPAAVDVGDTGTGRGQGSSTTGASKR